MKVLIRETFGGNRTYLNQVFLLEEVSNSNPSASFKNFLNSNSNSNNNNYSHSNSNRSKSYINISRDQRKSESNNLIISRLSPHNVEYDIDENKIKYNSTIDSKEGRKEINDRKNYNDNYPYREYYSYNDNDSYDSNINSNSNIPERDYYYNNKQYKEKSQNQDILRHIDFNKYNLKENNYRESN
jgi:hypothetical protein